MTAGLTLTQQKAVAPIHPDAHMGAATLAVATATGIAGESGGWCIEAKEPTSRPGCPLI